LNGDSNDSYAKEKGNKFLIIIGGSLISRGFTFDNLLVEVILNISNERPSMDTMLQRAR